MRIIKWEKLPQNMQTEEVRKYYDVLKKKRMSLFFKRLFDLFVSSFMLIALLPLFLVLALAIKMDSRGPVFYRQERVYDRKTKYLSRKAYRTANQDPYDRG